MKSVTSHILVASVSALLAASLFWSPVSQASSQTAVTIPLSKVQRQDNVLYCQYKGLTEVFYRVKFISQGCPASIQQPL